MSSAVTRGAAPGVVLAVALLALLAYLLLSFAPLDRFIAFDDDSVSYLIMARHFAPSGEASPLIAEAYLHERYPPLFPALLAIAGGAHDLLRAHLVVVAALLVALVLAWRWLRRESRSPLGATLVLAIFLTSPLLWPLMQRLVSEPLYLALTFAALLAAPERGEGGVRRLLPFALLVTALLFTRAIGLALVAAWGAHLLCARLGGGRPRTPALIPLLLPLAAAAIWYLSRPADPGHHYVGGVQQLLEAITAAGNPLTALLAYMAPQWEALVEAWLGALMLFWYPELNPRLVVAVLLGVLALAGLFLRLRRNALDAWYVLAYAGIVLLWPFPGQETRFLLPLLPQLLFYAFVGFDLLLRGGDERLRVGGPALLAAAFLALTLPAALLIFGRAHADLDDEWDVRRVPRFYTEASPLVARERARMHLLLRRDLAHIAATTPPDAEVMWFTPNYLALLAGRRGRPFPPVEGAQAMVLALAADPPDYIYVSRLHPRRTGDNGLAMLGWLPGVGQPVWATAAGDGDELFSLLLKVDPVALRRQAGEDAAVEADH